MASAIRMVAIRQSMLPERVAHRQPRSMIETRLQALTSTPTASTGSSAGMVHSRRLNCPARRGEVAGVYFDLQTAQAFTATPDNSKAWCAGHAGRDVQVTRPNAPTMLIQEGAQV